tara:strand:+ start:2032 stop:2163 length:132 start_codon:yes stop_codon:yes gene_type:complete
MLGLELFEHRARQAAAKGPDDLGMMGHFEGSGEAVGRLQRFKG